MPCLNRLGSKLFEHPRRKRWQRSSQKLADVNTFYTSTTDYVVSLLDMTNSDSDSCTYVYLFFDSTADHLHRPSNSGVRDTGLRSFPGSHNQPDLIDQRYRSVLEHTHTYGKL